MTTFFIEQFGCRATQADGAALERQLLNRGCLPAISACAADFVVINTCTVTAAADAQARDAIRKIHAANPSARIIATGCYAQRAPEELAVLPGVFWVVGNSHKPQVPQLLAPSPAQTIFSRHESLVSIAALQSTAVAPLDSYSSVPVAQHAAPLPPQILIGNIFAQSEFLSAPVLGGESGHTRPILKIQDGCNSRCAFCVIPFVRGKSHSLSPDQVICETRRLAESGFREIVLSGINLGTYGRDLSPRVEFIDLLRRILDETPVERLRISSIEPLDVTRDLIHLFAASDRIAHHFHMPLQSASDRILAAMHRWYRAEHYARRVELTHELLPDAALGADVITGFPGETEADHSATLSFIERLPFTYLHVFSYSQRPGTKAAALPNQVPGRIIKRRARELRALAEAKSAAFRRSQIGRTLRVLTLRGDRNSHEEEPASAAALCAAITPALSSNYLRVRIPETLPPNLWLDVQVSGQEGNCLTGEPLAPLCSP